MSLFQYSVETITRELMDNESMSSKVENVNAHILIPVRASSYWLELSAQCTGSGGTFLKAPHHCLRPLANHRGSDRFIKRR
ncbi:MAG: hypothetical protein LBK00_11420 [Treponema sp.]|jgi:hypothetical protein|nr:hypothetical protein [Treponema sp.]